MPGLAQRSDHLSNATSSCCSLSTNHGSVSNGFWSKHGDEISYNQLQKFWSDLPSHARQELLRIDKQTLFEQARKNMYCSRCNGLLLEGFLQIVMYGKSLQRDTTTGQLHCYKSPVLNDQIGGESREDPACQEEYQDPSVHPWGGLTTTRDGALTLLDCYLYAASLKGLQNVFVSARARERERELLYPDACGGGGRGWISQGMLSYGRGHGTRETCALHTARLSCDTLVDFWSALGEETRQSLLRMKEEDFIERLMYRFDSKRFCRDCRRNVIREFKELKELKRMRRETHCTTWFCVADTAFQYEVSNNTINADWHQAFLDSVGTYHHFEWAVGTGEGKSDILDFENVGMKGSAKVNGLDLGGLNACYITLRAWKPDGRCTELSVKAHALKGQQCVHGRLMVGDGYVTISYGENIRRFFEHAEEAEEEEDDDSVDKDGNELDGECSRPQKHAKSPELAREFLLDAATVIFKEQVEKAFREGTARQNAHSIFVCLALKLLEERVHVACKEIITLEKQMKLLEEEEKEKREEEERKERKRTKEREKKLRRKERLKGKDKEKKISESNQTSSTDANEEVSSPCMNEDAGSTLEDLDDTNTRSCPPSDARVEHTENGDMSPYAPSNSFDNPEEGSAILEEENDSFMADNSKISHRKIEHQGEFELDSSKKWPERRQCLEKGSMANKSESRYSNDSSECSARRIGGSNRQPRSSPAKFNHRNSSSRFNQKLHCSTNRVVDRSDLNSCGCNQQTDYRINRDNRCVNKVDSPDLSKPVYSGTKSNQSDYYIVRDSSGRSRSSRTSTNPSGREPPHTKKVWEPVEPQKRYPRSNSDSDVTLRSSPCSVYATYSDKSRSEICAGEAAGKSVATDKDGKKLDEARHLNNSTEYDLQHNKSCKSNGSPNFSASSSSSSDNCSSCLSEGDSNTASSRMPNLESSSTSDSEDGSQLSEGGKDAPLCNQSSFSESGCGVVPTEKVQITTEVDKVTCSMATSVFSTENSENPFWGSFTKSSAQNFVNGKIGGKLGTLHQTPPPHIHTQQNNIQYPTFQAPSAMGYYHQNQPVSWPSGTANGFMPYSHTPNHYLFPSPYGYGLSGGDSHFCMQYGTVQHLPSPPLLNPTHVPVYQPVLQSDGSHFLDQTGVYIKPNGTIDPSRGGHGREKVDPAGHQSLKEAPPASGDVSGNTGFSLFKFGGPLALSAYKPSSNSPDKGVRGDLSSDDSLMVEIEGKNTHGGKRDGNIEEYNLFATSKGIEFSIF